jgi:hypothetical protein
VKELERWMSMPTRGTVAGAALVGLMWNFAVSEPLLRMQYVVETLNPQARIGGAIYVLVFTWISEGLMRVVLKERSWVVRTSRPQRRQWGVVLRASLSVGGRHKERWKGEGSLEERVLEPWMCQDVM